MESRTVQAAARARLMGYEEYVAYLDSLFAEIRAEAKAEALRDADIGTLTAFDMSADGSVTLRFKVKPSMQIAIGNRYALLADRAPEAEKVEGHGTCEWSMVEDGDDDLWSTSCGQEWYIESDPIEGGYRYCPNCGRKVERRIREGE